VPAVPAATMVHGAAAITSMVEVALSSAVLLPVVAVPEAQVVPLPKLIWPLKVCAADTVTPVTFKVISVVDEAPTVVVLLQRRI